jgi:hypothetical protein
MRHGMLTVIGKVDGKRIHICRCDCGNTKEVRFCNWGMYASCGCTRHTVVYSEDRHNHPLYATWINIKARCYNQKNPSYKNYGARGIRVCDEWINDFPAFVSGVGDRPTGYELDRIDNSGDYEPGNVRWAVRQVQMRNQRRSRFVEYPDGKRSLVDIAKATGVDYFCLHGALRRGNDSAISYLRKKGVGDAVLRVPVYDNENPPQWLDIPALSPIIHPNGQKSTTPGRTQTLPARP